jgi:hypothetical protein
MRIGFINSLTKTRNIPYIVNQNSSIFGISRGLGLIHHTKTTDTVVNKYEQMKSSHIYVSLPLDKSMNNYNQNLNSSLLYVNPIGYDYIALNDGLGTKTNLFHTIDTYSINLPMTYLQNK